MPEMTLHIENMHCGACVGRVTQTLRKLDGVRVDEVRVGAARIEVPENFSTDAVMTALEKAGYRAVAEP